MSTYFKSKKLSISLITFFILGALNLFTITTAAFAQGENNKPKNNIQVANETQNIIYEGMHVEEFLIRLGTQDIKKVTVKQKPNSNATTAYVYLYNGWNIVYNYTTNDFPNNNLPGTNPQVFYLEQGQLKPETYSLRSGITYLVRLNSSGYINLTGNILSIQDIPLTQGWNLAGFLIDTHVSNFWDEIYEAYYLYHGTDTTYLAQTSMVYELSGYLIKAKYSFTIKCPVPRFTSTLLDFGTMQQGQSKNLDLHIKSDPWDVPIMDLRWTCSENASWITSLSPISGTTLRKETDDIHVTVNTSGLSAGLHETTIRFQNADSRGKWTNRDVTVRVNVQQDDVVSTPTTPTGPSTGKVGDWVIFETGGSTCSWGHEVEYQFDWGDGTYSDWLGYSVDHIYNDAGTFYVRARARCEDNHSIISGWSGSTSIRISYCHLSITINPSGAGYVTKNPNKTDFTHGETVQLTAHAYSDYTFDHWGGDLNSSQNPQNLTMDGDKSVTAYFIKVIETISRPDRPTGPSSGKVGQILSFSTGGSTSSLGHSVEYRFDWGDGNYSSWGSASQSHSYSSTGTFYIKAQARCQTHKNVVPSWSDSEPVSIDYCQLTISISPSGTGDVTKSPNKTNYTWNENVQLTAHEYSGYTFSHWGGDLSGSQNPKNLLMNGDKSVTAYFTSGPIISRAPTTLDQSCSQGSNAQDQSFEVWNSGGGTLSYSISDNVNWLYCSPTSGTSTGEHDQITVHYTTSGLLAGNYNATITISSLNASNSPQTISVNLRVIPNQVTISGYVRTSGGSGISGVTLSFSNGGGSTTTNSSGYYSKSVDYGWSGTVTPSKNGWTFSPSYRSYNNVSSNQYNQDYVGTPPPCNLSISSDIAHGQMDITNSLSPYSPDTYDINLILKKEGDAPFKNINIIFSIGDIDTSNFEQLHNYQGNTFWFCPEMNITQLQVNFKGVKIPTSIFQNKLIRIKILNTDVDLTDNEAYIGINSYFTDYHLNKHSYQFSNSEISYYILSKTLYDIFAPKLNLLSSWQIQILMEFIKPYLDDFPSYSCYGMTSTSLWYWSQNYSIYNSKMEKMYRTIAVAIFGQFISYSGEIRRQDSIDKILNEIKYSIINENFPITLGVEWGQVRHALLAYKIIEIYNDVDYRSKVYFYDPNRPFDKLVYGPPIFYINNKTKEVFGLKEDGFPYRSTYDFWIPLRTFEPDIFFQLCENANNLVA